MQGKMHWFWAFYRTPDQNQIGVLWVRGYLTVNLDYVVTHVQQVTEHEAKFQVTRFKLQQVRIGF